MLIRRALGGDVWAGRRRFYLGLSVIKEPLHSLPVWAGCAADGEGFAAACYWDVVPAAGFGR